MLTAALNFLIQSHALQIIYARMENAYALFNALGKLAVMTAAEGFAELASQDTHAIQPSNANALLKHAQIWEKPADNGLMDVEEH